MTVRSALLIVACLLVNACCCGVSEPTVATGLSSGTSFGMCAGYCTRELRLESPTVVLIETSRDPGRYPERRRTLELTSAEWSRLQGLVDAAALASVAGVNGCPDCADGGAEWIQVTTSQGVIRSTFEYGAVLQPIASLQAEIRSIRARFPQP